MRRSPDSILLHEIEQVEQRGTGHCGHGQEERELGGTLTGQSLRHAAHDGSHRARHSGNDRYALVEADVECPFLVDLLLVAALVEQLVAEQHEDSTNDQHHSHHLDAVEEPVEHTRLLSQQADDDCRQHANKKQPVEVVLMLQLLPRRASFGSRRIVELEEPLPVETHHRQDGTKLDDERKGMDERIALLNAQQVLGDNHVPRRRDGQELGDSLYDGNNDGLYPGHSVTSFCASSFGLCTTA